MQREQLVVASPCSSGLQSSDLGLEALREAVRGEWAQLRRALQDSAELQKRRQERLTANFWDRAVRLFEEHAASPSASGNSHGGLISAPPESSSSKSPRSSSNSGSPAIKAGSQDYFDPFTLVTSEPVLPLKAKAASLTCGQCQRLMLANPEHSQLTLDLCDEMPLPAPTPVLPVWQSEPEMLQRLEVAVLAESLLATAQISTSGLAEGEGVVKNLTSSDNIPLKDASQAATHGNGSARPKRWLGAVARRFSGLVKSSTFDKGSRDANCTANADRGAEPPTVPKCKVQASAVNALSHAITDVDSKFSRGSPDTRTVATFDS